MDAAMGTVGPSAVVFSLKVFAVLDEKCIVFEKDLQFFCTEYNDLNLSLLTLDEQIRE